jgi:hypothetical protein
MTGMLGSITLEVAIGLVFLYLLLAIFCTTVNEWIAGVLKTRAGTLKQGIQQLFAGQALAGGNAFLSDFYKHPLLISMMQDRQHPSYISASTFSNVLMDLVTPDQQGSITFPELEAGIKALPDGAVRKTLLALIQNTSADLTRAQQAIEGWFDDAMGRVSGQYKRRTQVWTIVIALALTAASNADTIHAARILWTTPAASSAAVEEAKVEAANTPGTGSAGLSDQQRRALDQMIGWSSVPTTDGFRQWAERVLGWLLTAIAVSLGAPFWFDTLNKFMNVRNAGRSPSEAPKTL